MGRHKFRMIGTTVLIAICVMAIGAMASPGLAKDRGAAQQSKASIAKQSPNPSPSGLKSCPAASHRPGKTLLLAGRYRDASRRNQANCQAWCRANPGCKHCSSKRGCGRGYDRLKTWGGRGKNWHACGKRPSRFDVNRARREECDKWCRANSDCVLCHIRPNCGPGLKRIKAFRGRGRNYYACARTKYGAASHANETACKKWCDENRDCKICHRIPCLKGQTTLRKWTGRGKNWYACSWRKR